jgi:hypothetical protein
MAAELIDKAQRLSMPELNEVVAQTKAAAVDLEARRRAIYARRSFRRWTDRDGAFQAHLYGNPEGGVGLWRVLDLIRRRLIMLRRGSSGTGSLDSLDYDALMVVAAIAAGRDGELALGDLLELGLFPQLDTSGPGGGTTPGSATVAHVDPLTSRPVLPTPASSEPVTSAPTTPAPAPPGAALSVLAVLTADQPAASPAASPPPTVATGAIPAELGLFPTVQARRGAEGASPAMAKPTGRRRRGKRLAGSPTRVMIRVDLDTLLRGVPGQGELCEVVGYGPIPVSVVEDLVANDNPFVVGVADQKRAHRGCLSPPSAG